MIRVQDHHTKEELIEEHRKAKRELDREQVKTRVRHQSVVQQMERSRALIGRQ